MRVAFWAAGGVVLVGGTLAAAVGSVGFGGPADVHFVAGSDVASLPTYGEDGSHILQYHHGETLTFTMPLENEALTPITVTDVRLDVGPQPLLVVEQVAVGGDLLPFRVGAGDIAEVRITARYTNCRYYHERAVETIPGVEVDASTLGIDVTRTVAFDRPFFLHSPMIVDCPDRTLVRDDDVRGENERRG